MFHKWKIADVNSSSQIRWNRLNWCCWLVAVFLVIIISLAGKNRSIHTFRHLYVCILMYLHNPNVPEKNRTLFSISCVCVSLS